MENEFLSFTDSEAVDAVIDEHLCAMYLRNRLWFKRGGLLERRVTAILQSQLHKENSLRELLWSIDLGQRRNVDFNLELEDENKKPHMVSIVLSTNCSRPIKSQFSEIKEPTISVRVKGKVYQ